MTERERDERDLAILDMLKRGATQSATAQLFNVTPYYVKRLVRETK
jgi:hypothetical protein